MMDNFFGSSQDEKLRDAAQYLSDGQKTEARKLLREVLSTDRNNLEGWELLLQVSNNTKEETFCLHRILEIDPNHATARRRLEKIEPVSRSNSVRRPGSRKKRQQSTVLFLLLGAFIAAICVSVAGFALYRGGYIPFAPLPDRTATAIAQKNSSCQLLIDQAIQASGSYCDNTSSNKVCYGNINLNADLSPDATEQFSERGDIIAVNELRRLSASPLDLESNEWGIAVFKVIANLPRSLPGETVTMVVFGNATLNNDSGGSENLESFYFSSELGQISCEQVPFDGLMITSPDGGGVRFMINGAELTLIGDASINAVRNGNMEVSLYRGSARIVSNGEEQYFGAGQKVKVQLGGDNGDEAVSGPSEPEPLSDKELDMACTLLGQFCSESEIVPISEDQAQDEVQSSITSTPTIVPTRTLSPTPSSTIPPTNTLLVLPSATGSPEPTFTPSKTKTPAPTKTPGPTRTPTSTNFPTFTPVPPADPICGSVSLSTIINPDVNQLGTNITNNSGADINIDGFFAYWVDSPTTQALELLILNGDQIWNKNDNDSPSDFPTEGNWRSGANLTIPNGATRTFLVQFREVLQPTGYDLHIFFDIGCQVSGKK